MNTPSLVTPKRLMKMTPAKALFCAALAPLLLTTHALGAVIAWDTNPAYQVDGGATGYLQVSTVGTSVTAVAFSSTTSAGYNSVGHSQTVNGVTFTSNALTGGDVTFAVSANASMAFDAGGTVGGAASPTSYTDLFNTALYMFDGNGTTRPIVFSGLNAGDTYQLQLWSSYYGQPNTVRFSDTAPTLSGGSYNSTNQSATLNTGGSGTSTTPQFTFGTFTASGTTQNIYWYGDVSNYGVLGAFQLRDTTPVPEPTTISLLSLGGLALIMRRKFRQRELIA